MKHDRLTTEHLSHEMIYVDHLPPGQEPLASLLAYIDEYEDDVDVLLVFDSQCRTLGAWVRADLIPPAELEAAEGENRIHNHRFDEDPESTSDLVEMDWAWMPSVHEPA